jgi:DnaJ-class molecular chaperone
VNQLWRKLVKLFHPDRVAHEPEKHESYHKLTAAIDRKRQPERLCSVAS